MANREHHYHIHIRWTGNRGSGTDSYTAYDRNGELAAEGKATIALSADPAFRGDATRWNPEELLLASASACHKLWYLHLCADAGIIVEAYEDAAEGTMVEGERGHFTQITLKPLVTLRDPADAARAEALHHDAHDACFIANSLNFPVSFVPRFVSR
ncbi:OsmC family protein [Pantoea sp. BS_4]|uniref:OsmC family protein n=2 Tax=Pantoea TaxID=53335 RepID=UPI0006320632|nr:MULTISPECIES: OsmC family protein [Pantoea]KKW52284.1 peroxiredoxin [Pantoea ananatis]MEB6536587.1 OsmC family protein [Pantoea stewartii]WRH19208.1 OsmC family peroxiredoxin [Pantoea sp. JZ29]